MTDGLLKIITQLFAVFASLDKEKGAESYLTAFKSYLQEHTNTALQEQLIAMFSFYLQRYQKAKGRTPEKQISIKSVKMLRLLESINTSCSREEKMDLAFRLMAAINNKEVVNEDEEDFLTTLFMSFSFDEQLMDRMRAFLGGNVESFANHKQLMIVSSEEIMESSKVLHLHREGLNGKIFIIYVESLYKFYFRYVGHDKLFLNETPIEPGAYYEFKKGQSITSFKIGFYNVKLKPIYFTEVVLQFVGTWSSNRVRLQAVNAAYRFTAEKQGIYPFNLQTESFLLVGIMGASGTGKSTLMNLLNGNLKPSDGKILLNGHDVYEEQNLVRGLIGYVPQEDLLVEELTVWENLNFNAQLCNASASQSELDDKVNRLLREMSLYDVRHLRVGSALDKTISGGQRKRLNLALEILREPAVLFVDEPTSGLSSSDSRKVMNILREVTLQGKLVIVNIHQPSSEIFRQLDQLLVLDDGGHIIYNGDALEAVVYFKTLSNQANASQKECPACGNINPDQILEIISERSIPDKDTGETERLVAPAKWEQWYKESLEETIQEDKPHELPESGLRIPGWWKQFSVFFLRNLKAKLPNTSYWLITMLEAPLLGLILGYFTKYNAGNSLDAHAYVFSENVNIPAYLLMSVIVALFLGMLVSAEEIIKDARIRKRESFLRLSRGAYLNAKFLFLILLIAYQSVAFVAVGNGILEIKGMFGYYALILFSVGIFAVLLGLHLSAWLRSVVAIYIAIPFLIIPQILLSGVLVEFDKLHSSLSNKIEPPFVADLMASRWGFEALAVVQFVENEYQQYFYSIEQEESNASYYANYYIPALERKLNRLSRIQRESVLEKSELSGFRSNLMQLAPEWEMNTFIDTLLANRNTSIDFLPIRNWLKNCQLAMFAALDGTFTKKDQRIDSLTKEGVAVEKLKSTHNNIALANLVKDVDDSRKWTEIDGKWIRTMEPVFVSGDSGYSLYYSPVKYLWGLKIPTWGYNVLVIWLLNAILYMLLLWPSRHIIEGINRSLFPSKAYLGKQKGIKSR
jgi:ABC-type multidrug transport system ATPase subunit